MMTDEERRKAAEWFGSRAENCPMSATRRMYEIATEALKVLEDKSMKRITNAEWIDLLTEQFNVSRTSAKEMLHAMMSVKKEDNFKSSLVAGKEEKMNEQKDIDKRITYKACTYALAELMRKGSVGFATVIDGEWVRRDYSLILETLYNIFEKEEESNDH